MWISEGDFRSEERDCSTPELEDWWKTSLESAALSPTSNLMLVSLTIYGILYLT